MKALVVTAKARHPQLPNVPTVAEAGFPDLVVTSWQAVAAPAKTPREVVAKLNDATVRALRSPDIRERMTQIGFDVVAGTPEEFGKFMKDEVERWTRWWSAAASSRTEWFLLFKKKTLTNAIEAIVAAGGSDAREAKIVAENLVTANLTGHDSHGVGMIPRYIESLLEGGLKVNQHPKMQFDGGAHDFAGRQPGLRPGDRPGSDGDRHRAREAARHLRDGPRPLAPPVPHRPVGRAGSGGRD